MGLVLACSHVRVKLPEQRTPTRFSTCSLARAGNNIVVIIEIKIEILHGVSLIMGSLHHIQITGSDIEGADYNNNIDKYYN